MGMQFGASAVDPTLNHCESNYRSRCANVFPNYDLTKPFINDYVKGAGGYVLFGADNLYPEIVTELYYQSALNKQIIDYKVSMMVGQGWYIDYKGETGQEKLNQASLDLMIQKSIDMLANDLIVHNRIYLRLCFDEKTKKLKTAKRIDPRCVRHTAGDMYGKVDKVAINRYWQYGGQTEYLPVYESKLRGKHTEYIYMYQGLTTGLFTYALPSWIGAFNWCYLDGSIANMMRANIRNSINPSIIFSFPRPFPDDQAFDDFSRDLTRKMAGEDNTSKAIIIEAQTPEDMPQITIPPTSNNDKLFKDVNPTLVANLCYAHGINPAVLGAKTTSAFSNGGEMIAAQSIFSDNIIEPLQKKLADYINGLVDIADLSGVITFGKRTNEKDVVKDVAQDKEAEARAALRGSVGGVQALLGVQAAVAAGTTSREAAIAILKLIYGFNEQEAQDLLAGTVAPAVATTPGVAPTNTNGPAPSTTTVGAAPVEMDKPAAIANDHIKNLTGRQMMGLMRILKKYDDGKLTKPQAVLMIMAFGLTEEEANTFLGDDEPTQTV